MTTMDRITAIRNSVSAFQWGVAGFLPIIGLVPSIIALVFWVRVRRRYHDWNPAAKYLKFAAIFGVIGLLNSGLASLVIGIAITVPWNG